jgi:hypothetical protein
MADDRQKFTLAGLALLGFGGLMLLSKKPAPPAAAPPSNSSGAGPVGQDPGPTGPGPNPPAKPPPVVATVAAVTPLSGAALVIKLQAQILYSVYDAQGRGPLTSPAYPWAATSNAADAINKAKFSPCGSYVIVNSTRAKIFTHVCGIATRTTYIAPKPFVPAPRPITASTGPAIRSGPKMLA